MGSTKHVQEACTYDDCYMSRVRARLGSSRSEHFSKGGPQLCCAAVPLQGYPWGQFKQRSLD